MTVYAKLVNTELTKYDVKDVKLYDFIKLALNKQIENGHITHMRDIIHINLDNYDSYNDGYYNEFSDTHKHTYKPLVTLNGKKLELGFKIFSNGWQTWEQLGVKENDNIEILAGELIGITFAFLLGDTIKLFLPNISQIDEITHALYHKRGLTHS